MKTISYTITDELGMHARPAGKIVKMAKEWNGKVEIGTSEKMVDCKRIMGVMALALKQGDTFTMTFEGEGEQEVADSMLAYMQQEL